jgi:hypothetical protein
MAFGDEKRMAGKERAMVEKGQRNVVLEDFVSGDAAADDLAEDAMFVKSERIFHLGVCWPRAG